MNTLARLIWHDFDSLTSVTEILQLSVFACSDSNILKSSFFAKHRYSASEEGTAISPTCNKNWRVTNVPQVEFRDIALISYSVRNWLSGLNQQ